MRVGLRLKILFFTVLPLAGLIVTALVLVNRSLTRQVDVVLRDDLQRAAAVFENMIRARFERLGTAGQVIVQDPRFFSVLTLPGSADEPQVRATVSGVAGAFNAIVKTDLFEVLDGSGRLLASVGPEFSGRKGRVSLVSQALDGHPVSGLLVDQQAHYQVTVTPVLVGGRVVGALLLGDRIGRELADELRELTRSEVTFLSGAFSTGSTLESAEDREAIQAAIDALKPGVLTRDGAVFSLRGPSHTYLTLARLMIHSAPEQRQVYVMQRALDVETAYLRNMQAHLVELGVIALIVALLAGFLISERITAPLQRLVRGAEEMERGNYDFPLEPRGSDEIGYLTSRFSEMRHQQRAYVKSLEEVARLKSEFISVASHELRTPISVINAYQELMAQGKMGTVSQAQEQALSAIGRSVNTLVRIAEDATRMAQIEGERLVLHVGDCGLADLVKRAIDHTRAAAVGRNVRLTTTIDASAGSLRVDGPRIVQALTQLLRNGVRFTPDGGEVSVHARHENNIVRLEVRDNGIGIPEETRAHIFDRAFSIRESLHHHSSSTLEFKSAGLGLGLSIARGIVEAHGGMLTIESEVGHGTRVTVSLPLAPTEVREAA